MAAVYQSNWWTIKWSSSFFFPRCIQHHQRPIKYTHYFFPKHSSGWPSTFQTSQGLTTPAPPAIIDMVGTYTRFYNGHSTRWTAAVSVAWKWFAPIGWQPSVASGLQMKTRRFVIIIAKMIANGALWYPYLHSSRWRWFRLDCWSVRTCSLNFWCRIVTFLTVTISAIRDAGWCKYFNKLPLREGKGMFKCRLNSCC